ncbi:universal stress protein [Pseudonocardia parietis]|uniref:Nucleotide-binding universal stress UspA family protein n=1 Tax=Pseudonocardia parietis TaxID=570936 RepID=A0ABS4VW50_9PSEU|nr:universal stress protein [Pseudonocardia parietis]MBP2368147.1 nucleotide-binding universal stress UspA family protein [Pseudonocardia parietis]
MDPMTTRPVAAGVDGSERSLVAARWAAQRARDLDVTLRLVAATGLPEADAMGLPPLGNEGHVRRARAAAAAALETATIEAREVLVAGRIDATVADATPVQALRDASGNAQLLAVGHRGRGGFAELLAGSVAVTVSATARCPVVVLRGEQTAGGPVVVGVDGSERSEAALGAAFAEAELRGAPLVALHAWADDVVDPYVRLLSYQEEHRREEQRLLDGALAAWIEKFPDVPVRRELVHERPVAALVAASAGAALVVVGSRGRGGLTGLLLGSVSRALLHHARCPVLVARG